MDLHAIKSRYNAAFDAYRQIHRRNTERAISGDQPSASDLEGEASALRNLEEARRSLWQAMGSDS